MSDAIKHECGIALVRLRKPLDYYYEKYQTPLYGLNKLYLLMEKQHNRGQDGAGVANIKFDVAPGNRYISRKRAIGNQPIKKIFKSIHERFEALRERFPDQELTPELLKNNAPFSGEIFLGHLRYGTFGENSIEACHPFLRQNNWMTRNLVVAGNFNLTNVDELFGLLVELGQHPKLEADTVTVMEKIGHFLDMANEELFRKYKTLGYPNKDISSLIARNLDIPQILRQSAESWDGGYTMAGLMGHGDAFVLRDPSGIRPAYYYEDEEVIVVASERPAIQTAFNRTREEVKELDPGHALVMKRAGDIEIAEVRKPMEKRACSFERIYFSRGSDHEIYQERKELGRVLVPKILETVDHDLDHTVFSFIPNTAETSFLGMVKGLEDYLNDYKHRRIVELGPHPDSDTLQKILNIRPRVEKIAIKDAKMRTFITQDSGRDDLVTHVYDITYGTIERGVDNLVVIDDSIVRGTTLKQSILRILDRLGPKKIVVVSSAPQIRYPDCYGIDMAKIGDFIAFKAAIALLKETGRKKVIDEVYRKSLAQADLPKEQIVNYVKEIYAPFTDEEISVKISQILRPKEINAEVQIIYQNLKGLHGACPKNLGDWYFSGDYPTPGGNKVVNRAFINYVEGRDERAY
ncbi:MAG: amidophosphoribosyltransferase [Salibacteraceae bacterium]